MAPHWLDLPNLRSQPSYEHLLEVVSSYEVARRNFDQPPVLDQGTIRWLDRLVVHQLDWLSEEQADQLKDKAAAAVSAQCGVTASAAADRVVEVGTLTIHLHEPGITSDNLGHKTWGASRLLAKRILDDPDQLTGSVCELGAGTGLVGIVAAKAGSRVVLTDLPEIMDNLRLNVQKNSLDCECYVLDWSKPEESVLNGTRFETLVISDPVYSQEHPEALLATIALLEASNVLLEIPLRKNYTQERDAVDQGLRDLGFQLTFQEIDAGDDDFGPAEFKFSIWNRRFHSGST